MTEKNIDWLTCCCKKLLIAYIGGGSRGWAWGLMSDLASCDDISGSVYLYDIDFQAAQDNEIIGNKYNGAEGAKSIWNYKAVETIGEDECVKQKLNYNCHR